MQVPFKHVAQACAGQGLHAVAVLNPLPERLSGAGLDRMAADGVGDLGWLLDQREMRLNPRGLLASATSMVIATWSHQPEPGDAGGLRRARYAAGKDYHHLFRLKLHRAGEILAPGHRLRAVVDSAPLNERTLAALAGLGWIGRNSLIISPAIGSYFVLGVLLTSADLAAHHPGQNSDRCGTCHRCEQRCPTAALRERRVVTERCISYLTIEHRGVIPRELALHFGGWWFGCDACQEACPWNRFAPEAADGRLNGQESDPLQVRADTFDQHFAGRAIRRIGYERFRRNLLVALFSLGRHEECAGLLSEGLPLVLAQAQELVPCQHADSGE